MNDLERIKEIEEAFGFSLNRVDLEKLSEEKSFQTDFGKPQPALEIQPFTPFPPLLAGQNRVRLHSVGNAHVQHLWLAEALLFVAGRLCQHLRRVDEIDCLGELRLKKWQSQMRGLHGSLRLRGLRRG